MTSHPGGGPGQSFPCCFSMGSGDLTCEVLYGQLRVRLYDSDDYFWGQSNVAPRQKLWAVDRWEMQFGLRCQAQKVVANLILWLSTSAAVQKYQLTLEPRASN